MSDEFFYLFQFFRFDLLILRLLTGAVVIVWHLDLQQPVQSVPITTEVLSSNPVHVQHYVIKFVSDLQQVGGFLWVFRFPPPIKLTTTI